MRIAETAAQSQQKAQKTLYNSGFSHAVSFIPSISFTDYHKSHISEDFKRDAWAYVSQLSGYEQKILCYFLRFRKAKRIKLRNRTVAYDVGCATRTVQRATRKLQEDGLIFKQQEHPLAPNDYYISPLLRKGRASFIVWLNMLSEDEQLIYMRDGFMPSGYLSGNISVPQKPQLEPNVTPNINRSKIESIYNNPCTGRRATRTHVEYLNGKKPHDTPIPSRKPSIPQTGRSMGYDFVGKPVYRRKVKQMNLESYKDASEFISKKFSYYHQTLRTKTQMSMRDTLMLFAFDSDAVKYALGRWLRSSQDGKRKGVPWVFGVLKNWCQKEGRVVQWQAGYALCDHFKAQDKKPGTIIKKPVEKKEAEAVDVAFLDSELEKWKAIREKALDDPKTAILGMGFIDKSIENIQTKLTQYYSSNAEGES